MKHQPCHEQRLAGQEPLVSRLPIPAAHEKLHNADLTSYAGHLAGLSRRLTIPFSGDAVMETLNKGGKNHQPTSAVRLIAPSAWLSQRVGLALSEVLQSNNELENAIIVGMERLHVEKLAPSLPGSATDYLKLAIEHLERSLQVVSDIGAAYSNLLLAADAENYKGNPLASRLKEFRLDDAFSGALVLPAINPVAWENLEDRIAQQNILATLAWEATEFKRVIRPTKALIAVLERCSEMAETAGARRMVEAIECNGLMLRQEFAKVFSLWNYLHDLFLYSALAMTELFYRTNAFGSLLLNGEASGRPASQAVA